MNKLRGSIHPPLCTQCLLQRQGASLLHPGGYSWFLPRSLAPWPKEKALLFRVQGSPGQCGVDESRGFRVQCKTHGKAWKERRTGWPRGAGGSDSWGAGACGDPVGCWDGGKSTLLLQHCCCPADRYQSEYLH